MPEKYVAGTRRGTSTSQHTSSRTQTQFMQHTGDTRACMQSMELTGANHETETCNTGLNALAMTD